MCGRGSRLRYGVVRQLRRHRSLRALAGLAGSLEIADLKVQAGSKEGLTCKEGSVPDMVWSHRGYKGLYRHKGALPNQGLWGQAVALARSRSNQPLRRSARSRNIFTLDPWLYTEYRNGIGVRHRSSEKPHRAARQDLVDIALRRTQGAAAGSGKGFSPAVSLA